MTLAWMLAPVVACVVMAVALGWFGFHVLQREVIFVDLALAQVAALGTTYAVFLGHSPDEPLAWLLGLGATVLGASAFSYARRFSSRVPQEALIGIAYAVSAGASALLLDFASDPHGAEKLQHLLVGNVVWVTWSEIGVVTAVCLGVGCVHLALRDRFLGISLDPEGAEARGIPVALWDLLFYLTFGLVITTVVHVAGVLLVFTWLVVPAVIARLFVDGVGHRLLLAWAVSIPVSVAGVAVSYEHAAGPIIVGLFGGCLLVALAIWTVVNGTDRLRAAGSVLAVAAMVGLVLWGFSRIDPEHEHEHEHAVVAPVPADPNAREAFYRQNAAAPGVLDAASETETDPSLRLLLGALLTKAADPHGLEVLAELAQGDVPFVRMEADGLLRAVIAEGAPSYDPLAGPDSGGAWAAAASKPPPGWQARAATIAVP